MAGGSPRRPPGDASSPMMIRPCRKVPVVTTVACARIRSPVLVRTPRTRQDGRAVLSFGFPDEAGDVGLEERQVRLRLQDPPHEYAVGVLVALGAQGADGRALAGIQLANLNLGAVGVAAHLAAERVDLTHQVALGRPADRGVAGHLGNSGEAGAQQRGASSHARGGQGRLAPGMAGADHQDVVAVCQGFEIVGTAWSYLHTRR